MTIEIVDAQKAEGLEKLLESCAAFAVKDETGGDNFEICLTLSDGEGIRALNAQYRGIDKATDVLSFPLLERVPGRKGEFWEEQDINPQTGESLPIGETGELVLTTINKEGLPMLRYRTKDITYLIEEKCACGRTTLRHASIQGRSDDMLIIRGVNVFPSQIEEVLLSFKEIGPHYEIIVRRDNYLDTIEILVEPLDETMLESFARLEALQNSIRAKLRVILQLDARVRLVEPHTLQRFEGKGKHVTDMRK